MMSSITSLLKNVDAEPVFMGVAEGECSIGSLRNQRMNSPAVVLRRLLGDAPAERGERGTDLESRVEAQREAGCERRPELPSIGLGGSAHHLQFAAGQAAGCKLLRIKSLKIV